MDHIPTALFANILPKLITVLTHTQHPDGVVTPQAKQALLHATNELKHTLSQAREYATALPGGDLDFDAQDKLIHMLEKLREHKRQELACFAQRAAGDGKVEGQGEDADAEVSMEIDSTASTPFGS